ncbi:hypothetical protein C8Q76DRAFT_696470 [Earliella scabrosa]|nr:hypothetical protein C8Q76DRAFT_696470 [Earliella scabrosa]
MPPHLPVEIDTQISDNLDLPALIAWRDTCRRSYQHVEARLDSHLEKLLHRFVPDAEAFLLGVESYRGLIIGLAALAFVVRDSSLLSDTVDVAVGSETAWDMEQYLVQSQSLIFVEDIPPPRFTQDTTIRIFLTPKSRYVRLLVSHTPSPFMPLARCPISALINYVSRRSFGCAYPLLTLSRLTLITDEVDDEAARDPAPSPTPTAPVPAAAVVAPANGDAAVTALPSMPPNPLPPQLPLTPADDASTPGLRPATPPPKRNEDTAIALLRWLRTHGFRDALTPSALLDPLAPQPCDDHPYNSRHPCYRDLFLCPDQSRFFGDPGSLVVFFDIAHALPHTLARRQYPPFNPTVVWRFQSIWTRCGKDCTTRDPMLGFLVREYDCLLHPDMVRHGPRFVGDRPSSLARHLTQHVNPQIEAARSVPPCEICSSGPCDANSWGSPQSGAWGVPNHEVET